MRSIVNSGDLGAVPDRLSGREALGALHDDSVIGSMFYIMDAVEGRIFLERAASGPDNAQRGEIFTAEVETLARLHQLDYNEIGLRRFRQDRQLFRAPDRPVDEAVPRFRNRKNETVERLIAFLPNSVPEQGSELRSSTATIASTT